MVTALRPRLGRCSWRSDVTRAPTEPDEVEAWLEREVADVRRGLPETGLRLLRLTQELPSGERAVGWLGEIDATCRVRVRLATAVISTLRPLMSSGGSLSRQERRKAATAVAILDGAEVLFRERGF